MSVILVLVLVSLGLALVFLAGFVWAVRSGQYEDTYTPALRVLAEDPDRRPGRRSAIAQPAQPQTFQVASVMPEGLSHAPTPNQSSS